ncbi:hypothetical protein DFJ74DRAFT_659340 [Hyaloraphidium curvatum]|nr:hypothetical protein DFJ74DRAFT_659340 [Hyaloraphidium curvatum]
MRLPFFYAFAGVVSASSAVKVAIGWTNLRELVDVVFPCLVGILYGTLSEREVRWWYIVRQRAVGASVRAQHGRLTGQRSVAACQGPPGAPRRCLRVRHCLGTRDRWDKTGHRMKSPKGSQKQ